MPIVENVYETQLCLTDLGNLCGETVSQICLDILIIPTESETYTYAVCVEDLVAEWDVPVGLDDPNDDGIFWEGPDSFTLSEVEDWQDGCQTYEMLDMDCSCPIEQTICIQVLGDEDVKTESIYMYDCQFCLLYTSPSPRDRG